MLRQASRQGFCSVRYSCCPGTRICRTASGVRRVDRLCKGSSPPPMCSSTKPPWPRHLCAKRPPFRSEGVTPRLRRDRAAAVRERLGLTGLQCWTRTAGWSASTARQHRLYPTANRPGSRACSRSVIRNTYVRRVQLTDGSLADAAQLRGRRGDCRPSSVRDTTENDLLRRIRSERPCRPAYGLCRTQA